MHLDAHSTARVISLLRPILILAAVGAWAFAMYGQISAYRARKPGEPRPISARFALGILVFMSIIGLDFAIDSYLESAAVQDIRPRLDADILSVTVNGTRVEKFGDVVAALRSIQHSEPHHSSPTTEYQILLATAKGPLKLQLCRDSQNPHEYWVYYPDPRPVTTNEIGRVFTSALDGL